MNLWLELDNCFSVVQLVRVLHRNRRATGSIPARGPIVAFFATVPLDNFHLQIPSTSMTILSSILSSDMPTGS